MLGIPSHNRSNHHMFALIFNRPERRAAFIDFMAERSITTPFHYVALHE